MALRDLIRRALGLEKPQDYTSSRVSPELKQKLRGQLEDPLKTYGRAARSSLVNARDTINRNPVVKFLGTPNERAKQGFLDIYQKTGKPVTPEISRLADVAGAFVAGYGGDVPTPKRPNPKEVKNLIKPKIMGAPGGEKYSFSSIDDVIAAYKQHGQVDLDAVRAEVKNNPEALKKLDIAQAERKAEQAKRAVVAKREREYGAELNALANKTRVMGDNGQLDVRAIRDFHKGEYELAKKYPEISGNQGKIEYYERVNAKATPGEAFSKKELENIIDGKVPTKTPTKGVGVKLQKQVRLPQQAQQSPQLPVKPSPSLSGSIPQNQRGFLETVQEAPGTPQFVKTKVSEISPQGYITQSLDPTIRKAAKQVADNYDEALATFRKGTWNQEAAATGQELVKKNLANGRVDEALNLIEEIDIKAREAGRGIQALSAWSQLTPEGMLRFAQREIDNANELRWFKKVPGLQKEAATEIAARMKNVQQMVPGDARDRAVLEVMDIINKQIPPGVSEIFDAYRYQNMLSSPLSQMRNIYSNTIQASITRPTTLATEVVVDWAKSILTGKDRAVYAKQIPQYYKGLFNSFPNATEAFKQVWSGKQALLQPDLRNIRTNQLPKGLTVTTRFMEGMDRFGQTLVASGEYASRKAAGASDEVARASAEKMAQYSLFRQGLDPANKSGQGRVLSAIDGFTKGITDLGKRVPPLRWFVPFIQTPMNIAKQMVEYSPAGLTTLVGAGNKSEQLSKAMIGSVATAIGATFALQGRTTWEAPKDPKQKELFYASGKKPYSILVGDKWVPMWYAGPVAYALALPAAVKYYQTDSPTALTDDQMDKLGRAALGGLKYWVNQTSLKGMGDFVRFAEGDDDYSLGRIAGSVVGQTVPLTALQRYVANIVDPIYRKSKGAVQSIQSGIPGLSKSLEPYTNPLGEPSKRNISNYVAPWAIGQSDDRFVSLEKARQNKLQSNALVNKAEKGVGSTGSGQFTTPDGRTVVVLGDEVKTFDNPEEAALETAKYNFRKETGAIKEFGDFVLRRNKDGDITAQPKLEYDYSLNTNKLQSLKAAEDYKGWSALAVKQLENLAKQYEDPSLDDLEKSDIEEKARTLAGQIEKYSGYGGFKKGKKGRKGSAASLSLATITGKFSAPPPLRKQVSIKLKGTNAGANFARLRLGGGSASRGGKRIGTV